MIASSAPAQTPGTPLIWGWANAGQLGDSSPFQRSTPFQVPAVANLLSVASGGEQVLAWRSDGTVWAWGKTPEGWIGDAWTPWNPWNRSDPVQVPGLAGVRAVAASPLHNLALLGDGTVVAWGKNSNLQLGDGTHRHRPRLPRRHDRGGEYPQRPLHAYALLIDNLSGDPTFMGVELVPT